MGAETALRIAEFLDAHHVISLATSGSEGPHATSLFYARDGFSLLWMSDPSTRHSTEIEVDSRAAATIASNCFDFEEICGLQISGRARRLRDSSERTSARQILEARYPFLKRLSAIPPGLRNAYGRVEFYRLDSERLVLIDNSRGFGHKETLEIGEAAY